MNLWLVALTARLVHSQSCRDSGPSNCPDGWDPLGNFCRDVSGMQCMGAQNSPQAQSATDIVNCGHLCAIDPGCDFFQYCHIADATDPCSQDNPKGVNGKCGCWLGKSGASNPDKCGADWAGCRTGADWADLGCSSAPKCAHYWLGCSKHAAIPGGDPFGPNTRPAAAKAHSGALGFGWLAIIIGGSLLVVASIAFVAGGAGVHKVALKRSGVEMWSHLACIKHFVLLVWDGTLTTLTCGKKQLTRTKQCGSVADQSAFDAYLNDDDEDDAGRVGIGGGGGAYQASGIGDLDDDDL